MMNASYSAIPIIFTRMFIRFRLPETLNSDFSKIKRMIVIRQEFPVRKFVFTGNLLNSLLKVYTNEFFIFRELK